MGHPRELLDKVAQEVALDYAHRGYNVVIEKSLKGTRMIPDVQVLRCGEPLCVVEIGYTDAKKIARYRKRKIPDIRWYSKEGILVLREADEDRLRAIREEMWEKDTGSSVVLFPPYDAIECVALSCTFIDEHICGVDGCTGKVKKSVVCTTKLCRAFWNCSKDPNHGEDLGALEWTDPANPFFDIKSAMLNIIKSKWAELQRVIDPHKVDEVLGAWDREKQSLQLDFSVRCPHCGRRIPDIRCLPIYHYVNCGHQQHELHCLECDGFFTAVRKPDEYRYRVFSGVDPEISRSYVYEFGNGSAACRKCGGYGCEPDEG